MESQLTTHNRRVETEILARQGLRLPPITLTCLRTAGIYCQPSVSIEHQHLAKKYELRRRTRQGIAVAAARGQHWRKRRARDRGGAGTDPGANASDRADLRSAHYP